LKICATVLPAATVVFRASSIVLGARFAYSVRMIQRLFILTAWIATALSLPAASLKFEFITVGPNTYSNVTVLGANASDLFFTSDKGITNVKLKRLSPELQKQFNYDPDEAEKAEQQQIEDDARYHENLANTIAAEFNAARDAKEAQAQALYSEAGLVDPVGSSPIGKPVPALDMEKWIGAKPILAGKFAIISVWSPKSVPCRKWIPPLNDLNKTLGEKLAIVGVTPASEAEVAQSEPKIDFPCAIDTEGKFISAAGITSIPCVMLLDTNSIVRYQGHPAALTAEVLQNIFKKAAE
jgi:hypothetical protein